MSLADRILNEVKDYGVSSSILTSNIQDRKVVNAIVETIQKLDYDNLQLNCFLLMDLNNELYESVIFDFVQKTEGSSTAQLICTIAFKQYDTLQIEDKVIYGPLVHLNDAKKLCDVLNSKN